MPISLADRYLSDVYTRLGLSKANSKEKYNRLTDINSELDRINSSLPKQMNVKTTGTINERLVQLALEGFMPESWYSLNDNKYQWLGDFGVQGYPLSVVISVKSFKTKELHSDLQQFNYQSALFIHSENGIDKNFKLVYNEKDDTK